MSNYFIAPEARFDLEEIWSYYAVDLQNVETADRVSFSPCNRPTAC